MRLFLKDKRIQVARIILLLIAGIVFGIGQTLAFSLGGSTKLAILILNTLIVIVTAWAMRWSEP